MEWVYADALSRRHLTSRILSFVIGRFWLVLRCRTPVSATLLARFTRPEPFYVHRLKFIFIGWSSHTNSGLLPVSLVLYRFSNRKFSSSEFFHNHFPRFITLLPLKYIFPISMENLRNSSTWLLLSECVHAPIPECTYRHICQCTLHYGAPKSLTCLRPKLIHLWRDIYTLTQKVWQCQSVPALASKPWVEKLDLRFLSTLNTTKCQCHGIHWPFQTLHWTHSAVTK